MPAIERMDTSDLLWRIRYEIRGYDGGAHTYGHCHWCGKEPARGGGTCIECALNELERRHKEDRHADA